jgi:hypothetical protein
MTTVKRRRIPFSRFHCKFISNFAPQCVQSKPTERDQANELLINYLSDSEEGKLEVYFDHLFSKPGRYYDHLRPGGKFVGYRDFEQTENDDGVASGSLSPNSESRSSRDVLEDTWDSIDHMHADHNNP